MKNFIYLKSNLSGIGDRLLDLILIYTYAKYLNCKNIYLEWRIDTDIISANDIHSIKRKIKTSFREKDYLLENILRFIQFPEDIIFVNKEKLSLLAKDENNILFEEYLGLKYPIDKFISKYLKNIDNEYKNIFIDEYHNNLKKIKFKNIPENISTGFLNNEIITIHLRRGDKVINDDGAAYGILEHELSELDSITCKFIDKYISTGYKNFCFVSDEVNIKNTYINKYKNICNVFTFKTDEISQTYYDMFCLANSHCIFLSQRFSSFSILCSLINGISIFCPLRCEKLLGWKNIINFN